MDIKSKNRHVYFILFIICIYLLGISLLSAVDIYKNKKYFSNESYFQSVAFYDEFYRYFDNLNNTFQFKVADNSLQKSQYQPAKKYIDSVKAIKYYIKDKTTGKIYTNLEDVTNIDSFITKEALHVEQFPRSTKADDILQDINQWFKTGNYEGKFIILKSPNGYSQLIEDYQYYNSIRNRMFKELKLFFGSFASGLVLLIVLMKTKEPFPEKFSILYHKVPIDVRILFSIICIFLEYHYQMQLVFFYKPINIRQGIELTEVSIFILYLIFIIREVVLLKNNGDEFGRQFKDSTIYKSIKVYRESKIIKKEKRKIRWIFFLTLIFAFSIALVFVLMYGRNGTSLLPAILIYMIAYLMFIPQYVFKKLIYLKKIMDGTEEITSGNLNYVIEENGEKDLSKLAKNINNMKNGFKKSLESQVKSERLKSELITNVSHDLKTPLTSIINYTDILKSQNLTEEEKKSYIDILDRKSQRLKVLIEDLFEASKMASGTVEFHPQKVDIVALLRQALGEFDEKIRKSSLSFKFNTESQNIYVYLDGNKTWRVFDNLINNILKYSQEDTRVYINITEELDIVRITMKNISSYEMDFDVEEIFERFKRGDKARNTEGSGLGLAIAKSIVEQQGGKLRIEIDGDLFKSIIEFKKYELQSCEATL